MLRCVEAYAIEAKGASSSGVKKQSSGSLEDK